MVDKISIVYSDILRMTVFSPGGGDRPTDSELYSHISQRLFPLSLAGTSVLKVSATDEDATSPNNDFFYRIESGAQDKFRINFSTGEIFVESGARLDREQTQDYSLRVSATDRGNSPLTGFSSVTIILDNVNDELPRFSRADLAVTISENTAVGGSVLSYVATDSDDDSDLRYSLLKELTKAFDENGETVDAAALGVDVSVNFVNSCHNICIARLIA